MKSNFAAILLLASAFCSCSLPLLEIDTGNEQSAYNFNNESFLLFYTIDGEENVIRQQDFSGPISFSDPEFKMMQDGDDFFARFRFESSDSRLKFVLHSTHPYFVDSYEYQLKGAGASFQDIIQINGNTVSDGTFSLSYDRIYTNPAGSNYITFTVTFSSSAVSGRLLFTLGDYDRLRRDFNYYIYRYNTL